MNVYPFSSNYHSHNLARLVWLGLFSWDGVNLVIFVFGRTLEEKKTGTDGYYGNDDNHDNNDNYDNYDNNDLDNDIKT